MSTLRIAGVIPARLSSTRLSRKVLRTIAGRPMVEWVWRAAQESGLMDPVLVATDAEEVAEACRERGIPVAMTSPDCASGSDRVREVARSVDADIYVNIQGDEPTLRPEFFPPLLALFDRPEVEVATLAVPCPAEEFADPNAVKVVTALDGRALYFSRATIPFDRDQTGFAGYRKHLGIYAYRIDRAGAGSLRCRPRLSKKPSGWSNCGCWKTALRSTLPKLPETPSAWTPRPI